MRRVLPVVLILLGCSGGIEAGLAPHNVLVVVNEASWTSKAIANEYVKLRHIPPTNVVYLNDVPVSSQITVEEFRLKILKPIILKITEREIAPQIQCIAYSSDFPWRIDLRDEIKHKLAEGQNLPKELTPFGSLTGMTYLLDYVFHEDIDYLQRESNAYFRKQSEANHPFAPDEVDRLLYREAMRLKQNEKWKESAAVFERLLKQHDRVSMLWYLYACCLAQDRQTDDALKALEKAVQNGWSNREKTEQEPDFEPLNKLPGFERLLELMQKPMFDTEPGIPFSHLRGFEVPFRDEPVHYMMSTILGVTEGRGNSVAEIINSLKRSAEADHTIPAASFYFTSTDDVRSTTRESWFESAAAKLEAMGKHAIIVEEPLPRFRRDIGGIMAGTAGFDWPKTQSVIKPGAICEHLTSYGGIMTEDQGQTPISEWIRYGAAGTSGTVYEPFALQEKFPTPFLHVFYARGFSLAESFYLTVQSPYQLLILGDPLCQPWAIPPRFEVSFEADRTLDRSVPLLTRSIDPISRFLIVVDGVEQSSTAPGVRDFLHISALDEGSHTLSVIAVDKSNAAINHVRSYPFVIDRLFKSIELTLVEQEDPKCCRIDGKVTLKVACDDARQIQLFHNSRKIGEIEGGQGTLEVDGETLGLGEVELIAKGIADEWTVHSKPLKIQITPPPLRQPLGKEAPRPLKPGLLLSVGGRTQIIESLTDLQWLTRAEVKPDETFKLEGYVEVDKDDLYQLQIEGNLACEILWNGVPVEQPALEKPFRCVPLSLASGRHHLVITGTMQEDAELLFRFGNQGRKILGKPQFETAPWSRED